MALTPTGRIIVASALIAAVLSLAWPYIAPESSSSSACPLGFGPQDGPMPEDHPQVPGGGISAPKAPQRLLLLLHNGTVWTADPQNPVTDALLVDVAMGEVLGVGDLQQLSAVAKEVVEEASHRGRRMAVLQRSLDGKFVMPGFVDPHVHLIAAGLMLSSINLGSASSRQAFQQTVQQGAQALPPDAWVVGGLWDDNKLGAMPDKTWLDAVTGGRPAFLTRMDGHMGLANSAALQLAGIRRDTPDPEGGIIDRGADGQPTGILRENAIGLVTRLIPAPSLAQRQAALAAATAHAHARGVTTVACMGRSPFTGDPETSWQDLEEVFIPAADSGELGLRVYAFVPLSTWSRMATHVAANGRYHISGRLSWGGVKEFADGSLGSSTALMWEPYVTAGAGSSTGGGSGSGSANAEADASEQATHGTRMISTDRLYEMALGADAAGLQIAVHAIGDRAVDEVAHVYARVKRRNAKRGATSSMRHRIEHVQHIRGSETARLLAELELHATPNPLHLLSDAAMLESKLGWPRAGAGHAYALRTLKAANVSMGMASDWPVVDLDPISSVFVSAFRRDPSGGTAWAADEGMPIEEALLAHTAVAAQAAGLDDYIGSLREGMRADFIMLDTSPMEMKLGAPLPHVMATFIDGVCMHGAEGVCALFSSS